MDRGVRIIFPMDSIHFLPDSFFFVSTNHVTELGQKKSNEKKIKNFGWN